MFLEEYKEIYIANKKKIEEWEKTLKEDEEKGGRWRSKEKQLTEMGRGNLTDKKRAGMVYPLLFIY